jgi:hypothetical protein
MENRLTREVLVATAMMAGSIGGVSVPQVVEAPLMSVEIPKIPAVYVRENEENLPVYSGQPFGPPLNQPLGVLPDITKSTNVRSYPVQRVYARESQASGRFRGDISYPRR